jgi:hypothetical protein
MMQGCGTEGGVGGGGKEKLEEEAEEENLRGEG